MSIRYVYPKVGTTNFGDYLIDTAIRQTLAAYLPEPAAFCDIRHGHYPIGEYDCLLVPGITHLTAGAMPGLDGLDRLPYPAFCLSGNVWRRQQPPGWLLRTRVVRGRQPAEPDLSVAAKFATPVGARDPHTHALLRRAGIETLYTGCATLWLAPEGTGDDGYVLFSVGRGHLRAQTRAARQLARKHLVIGICHEIGDEDRLRAAGWQLPLATWQGDNRMYLSYFKRARWVVTGRLHGALPALSFGKPVFYFGTRDSRTTLLDDLGVSIHSHAEIPRALERATPHFNRALIECFRDNWDRLIHRVLTRIRHSSHAKSPQAPNPERLEFAVH